MEDLASYAMGLDPLQRAKIMARAVRGQPLMEANQQAHSMDVPAAAAMMSNNPELAKAAEFMGKQRQSQFKPITLGHQGFALPGSGEFVASPMFEDEQNAQRQSREQIAEAQRQAVLQRTHEAIQSREGMAEQQRQLRLTLAAIGGDRAAEKRAEKAAKDAEKAAEKAKGKTMPISEITKLAGKDSLAGGFEDLYTNFKDEYGGSGSDIIGSVVNELGKKQPLGIGKGYADQSNWWQNYNEKSNQIRHELFGSALTAAEKAAFDKANITEGMQADEIRRRLQQQHAAATAAYNKILRASKASGWNTEGFSERADLPKTKPGAPLAKSRAPSGVDQTTWDHMTPEERKLWQN